MTYRSNTFLPPKSVWESPWYGYVDELARPFWPLAAVGLHMIHYGIEVGAQRGGRPQPEVEAMRLFVPYAGNDRRILNPDIIEATTGHMPERGHQALLRDGAAVMGLAHGASAVFRFQRIEKYPRKAYLAVSPQDQAQVTAMLRQTDARAISFDDPTDSLGMRWYAGTADSPALDVSIRQRNPIKNELTLTVAKIGIGGVGPGGSDMKFDVTRVANDFIDDVPVRSSQLFQCIGDALLVAATPQRTT